MSQTKTWYITGASKGMGLSLVKQLLEKGQRVAATSRSISAFDAFRENDNFLPLETDLKSEPAVAASIRQAVGKFGRLDVVVNNAGYGLGGALEELTAEEINENFEINFFAVVRVIQQALPYMRQQRSGHIINISSIAGFAPGLGWAVYCAAKFAVSGLSAALTNDLKPLGIHVTNVMPGAFRTSFAAADSIAFSRQTISDYEHLRASHAKLSSMDGAQPGDPDKMADIFLQLTSSPDPATDLFLGSDAYHRATARIAQLQAQMNTWKAASFATDFSA
ncbi:SDR family NAD(P)-dependent oxidoreductase [Chitinophaga oryzae]|uniref:SDR family NAD(P)-dependent oxidoreductase n=1 Tax=Chitinophaga oryzae TaxID=2725414 RepID=A0AAE7D6T7_9BACT|nr:SDR family NAD(P)-dependent oxidoreductase [Chitinophaga oryzae]QJB31501.1 SDR family NAD(P)-dependent oxidoreductase [Chitinophaga oryzae]QJB37982.1 SDR family NAD(P)-dependent oxidoreductase [Chitinophaga oryzae]